MTLAQTNYWNKALLETDTTVKDAIVNLNESMLQIVMVVDETSKLVGTITDGDIRRALLNDVKLDHPINKIINKNPFVVSATIPELAARDLMVLNRVQQVPIVDENGIPVGLHLWRNSSPSNIRPNTMVIMVGGKGQRLYPHTESCPKPMLEIEDKPILQHIIEQGKLSGIRNYSLATNYLGHMIEEYFNDGSSLSVNIKYIKEPSPLGTAGALSLIGDLPTAPILVTNGDVLTKVNYGDIIDFHEQHHSMATMAVFRQKWENPFGVVKLNGIKIVGFEEKPVTENFINAGIYVLDPRAIAFLDKNKHCDMPQLLQSLMIAGEVVNAYPIHETWIDVGRHADLELARM